MKRILLALALVLVMSAGVFAADVTISGEVKYGFDKYEDLDAVWYANPGFKLTFKNDNFELRMVGGTQVNGVDNDCEDSFWYFPDWTCGALHCRDHHHHYFRDTFEHHDCDVTYTTQYGVKVDRANVKLPVEGFGTFVAGRQLFGTSDNGALDQDPFDGFGWSGTFDALSLNGMYSVGEKNTFGARAAYAMDLGGESKLTIGGTYLSTEDDDDASYALDARYDFGEAFDIYAEVGRDVTLAGAPGVYDDEVDDIGLVCAEFRVGGFELDGSYDFAAEETAISVEKTINNVLLHAGYIMPEGDGADEVEVYAKYKF